MTAEVRASIIVNNFNYARFLGDAIDSALEQTYPNVEVIVVDDGSTDDSLDVAREYGDRIIPVFKDNGGQGSAYNAGYERSAGEIVCFLDADDTLLPDALASAVALFGSDRVVKVQLPLVSTDATGRVVGAATIQPPPDGSLLSRIVDEGPLYDLDFVTNAVYQRRFLDQVMPVPDEAYRLGADEYLMTLAPVYGDVATAATPGGTYRSHGQNNFHGRPIDDARAATYLSWFDRNAAHLASHLRARGYGHVDPERWRKSALNYLWPSRFLAARRDIRTVVPDNTRFLLIDGGEWGPTTAVDGRTAIRLMERGGDYWGPPENDETVIAEVRRRSKEGIRFFVLWWTCDWWFDAYPDLFRVLATSGRPVVATDAVTIFELTAEPGP